MNNVSIQLGSVELRDFEVPPYIIYGGNYRLSIHRLASGQRTFERLGPDETDIRFTGAFTGPDAASRARAIDHMRIAGRPVWLTWSSFRYLVIVSSFIFRYSNPLWVEYRARCVVVRAQGASNGASVSSSAQAASDLAIATAALPAYASQLAPLSYALAANDAFTPGTSDAFTATNSATQAETALDSYIENCSGTVVSLDLAGSMEPGAGQLLAAYSAAGQLASAVVSRNYISRILSTLSSVGS